MEFVICLGPTDGPGATQAQSIQAVNITFARNRWCTVLGIADYDRNLRIYLAVPVRIFGHV